MDSLRVSLRILGISLLATVLAFGVAWLLLPIAGNTSAFFLCFLAIVICNRYIGLYGGLVCIILSTIGIEYFFLSPYFSFVIGQTPALVDLILFLCVSILVSVLIEKIKNPQEILMYKHKEKEYMEVMTKMQKEIKNYQKEIKARDEFLSIASHELKTPLSSMLLQLQTALYNIRNVSLAKFSVENLLKMLQSAEQQSTRLSKMINDLLNVSLITTGRLELETEEVDLAELVRDVAERFNEKAKREESSIKIFAEGKIIGQFDKVRIEQAVSNLISNALKYGDKKPVEVGVVQQNSTAKITVQDQGIGIPPEQQEKIFERFERAVSKHDYKGLGVGLYITYQIVQAHEGKIKLNSRENLGSTFTIELPLKKLPNK